MAQKPSQKKKLSVLVADRDLNKLHPDFKAKVDLFLKEVEPMGVFVTEAFRSTERQAYLVSKELSWTKISNHELGMAIDIAFKDDKRTSTLETMLYPSNHSRWREVADIAKKYGIDWGYDLWKIDKPHFQDNPNIKIMTEAQIDAIDAVIYSLKAMYHLGNDVMKAKANRMAQDLRDLKVHNGK